MKTINDKDVLFCLRLRAMIRRPFNNVKNMVVKVCEDASEEDDLSLVVVYPVKTFTRFTTEGLELSKTLEVL